MAERKTKILFTEDGCCYFDTVWHNAHPPRPGDALTLPRPSDGVPTQFRCGSAVIGWAKNVQVFSVYVEMVGG